MRMHEAEYYGLWQWWA